MNKSDSPVECITAPTLGVYCFGAIENKKKEIFVFRSFSVARCLAFANMQQQQQLSDGKMLEIIDKSLCSSHPKMCDHVSNAKH